VHLELDTGMSRQGVAEHRLDEVLTSLKSATRLRLAGVMTHLYAADETDGTSTHEQLVLLQQMIVNIAEAGLHSKENPLWLHFGNSAAVLGGDILRELRTLCQRWGMRPMARPGLALYGLAPEFYPEEPRHATELRSRLRRVLEWKTRVVSVRDVAARQVVGYNATFVSTEPMRLALLAVGYGDGLKRALSGQPGSRGGFVLLGGQRAPIVGRISMDQTVVDVTEIPFVAEGDEAVLLGRQGDELVTAEEHAAWAETIPWEIFTSIAARVERRGPGTSE
jgi:alanine racemase